MQLGQYDYLFAIGTIFAFLDAWNIGRYLQLSRPSIDRTPALKDNRSNSKSLQVPTMLPIRGPPRSVLGL